MGFTVVFAGDVLVVMDEESSGMAGCCWFWCVIFRAHDGFGSEVLLLWRCDGTAEGVGRDSVCVVCRCPVVKC